MNGWLIGILAGIGTLLLGVVKADLEDAKVCRWLAHQLVYRATRSLPEPERDRWREESIRALLDLPGRLPPLLWALDVYRRSGSWGRLRGGPSRWQQLATRVRAVAAWVRSRLRPQPTTPPTEPVDAGELLQRVVETIQQARTATTGTIRPVGIPSGEAVGRPKVFKIHSHRPDGLPDLAGQDFVAWLRQERRGVDDDLTAG